jgi:hypothetical protein
MAGECGHDRGIAHALSTPVSQDIRMDRPEPITSLQDRLRRAMEQSVRIRFEIDGTMEHGKHLVWTSRHLIRRHRIPLTAWGPTWICTTASTRRR